MEARLAEVDHQLRTGGAAVSPSTLPADLGPLPPALRQRALRTLQETQTALARAEAARDGIADALHQNRAPVREPAAYIDTWM
jgi:hypothetical protein